MRHPSLHLLLLAALFCSSLPLQAGDIPLGRLFFSPDKRSALDRQRQLNLAQMRELSNGQSSLTVNGLVRRSSGKGTAWVNGTQIAEDPVAPEHNTSDKLGVGERKVRVGERLNPESNETEDLLKGGQIVIRRPRGNAR